MRRMLIFMLACLLPLTALAEGETVLPDTRGCWGETVHLRVAEGLLYMTRVWDEEEPCQPVTVKEGFAETALALAETDDYWLDPDRMSPELVALLDDPLTDGRLVADMDVQRDQILLFLEGPGDGLTLRIAEWNGAGYDVLDNPTFPAGSWMDGTHYDDGTVVWIPYGGELGETDSWGVYLIRAENGHWRMGVRLDCVEGEYAVRWQAVLDEQAADGRNDGYYYGEFPAFTEFDIGDCPLTLDKAVAQLDRSCWAVVNNPNPEDRLCLYAAPDRDAETLGAFYNRTPARVIGSQGAWTEVVIGAEGDALTGWMTTEYLAFGEDMDEVACAFPVGLELKNGERCCAALAVPEESACEEWMFYPDSYFVIGELGDEWTIVMQPYEGWVGYVPQDWLVSNAGIALEDTETYWNDTVHSRVADGYLYMTVDGDDPYQPVAVKEGFVDAVRALEASGERYNLEPSEMEAELRALLDDPLTDGRRVEDMDVQRDQIILFLEGPGDGLTLRVATWNGAGYDVMDNPTFPAGSWLDTIHYDDGIGMWLGPSEVDGWAAYLDRSEEGAWRLGVVVDSMAWDYEWGWRSIVDWDLIEDGRNDGYYYGDYPLEADFEDFDASAYPNAKEEALALLDRSCWAVVNNRGPEEMLRLYAAPEEGAEPLGMFYNRTPVRAIGAQGDWTEVVIGEEGDALTGWMMTAYLAFGEDMDEVACAFPLGLTHTGEEYPCAVRATPEESAPEAWRFFPNYDFLIGELGDEWYVVMESNEGWVGYVPQSWLVPNAE